MGSVPGGRVVVLISSGPVVVVTSSGAVVVVLSSSNSAALADAVSNSIRSNTPKKTRGKNLEPAVNFILI